MSTVASKVTGSLTANVPVHASAAPSPFGEKVLGAAAAPVGRNVGAVVSIRTFAVRSSAPPKASAAESRYV